MNPYLIVASLVAVMIAGAGGFKLGMDHQKASEADKRELVAEAVDAANQSAAQAIAKIKVTNQTINQEVRREVETHTVYAECRATPGGLSGINAALSGAKPAGDSKLPQADAAN